MKIGNQIFGIFTFLVVLISAIYFIFSILNFYNLETHSLNDFYKSISEFAGIHQFMFLVLATYLGLRRLKLSQQSHEKAISQLKLTQDEISHRKEVEKKNETLKQCEYYLNEIQNQYKSLIQNDHYSGIPVKWSKLDKISRKSLEKNYPASVQKILISEKALKSESLLTLYKLEAFAAIFLQGNADLNLGKKIIGNNYVKQVGFLLGLIAFYQTDENDYLFKNLLELKNKWE